MKLKTYVLPSEIRLKDVSTEEAIRRVEERFDVVWNRLGREYTVEEYAELLKDAEVVITSWGSPSLSKEMLEQAPKLKAIGHAAGTVKKLLPEEAFSRGIKVFSANRRIALSVGEHCLTVLLAMLRQLPRYDANIRQSGGWRIEGVMGRELAGSTIGIVSASQTARAFIRLLEPFHVNLKIYDPFLSAEEAAKLGASRASLEEVMQCPIISVHAPNLPATKGLITQALLRLIPDGAIFINSSRADVIDEHAMLEELSSGRFQAAFDVYWKEPLAANHPLRKLDNVLLTPHIAALTEECHNALLGEIADDIWNGLNGEATLHQVNPAQWSIIA